MQWSPFESKPLQTYLPMAGYITAVVLLGAKDGVWFAVPGYEDTMYFGHPFHFIPGELTWDEPNDMWYCGKAYIRRVDDPAVLAGYETWRKQAGKLASREWVRARIIETDLAQAEDFE